MKPIDIENESRRFETSVSFYFQFLEKSFEMKRDKVKVKDRNSERDMRFVVRYESKTHRIDIEWCPAEFDFGAVVFLIPEKGIPRIFFPLEPFIEFLTKEKVLPIVPQVYPGMSISKLYRVADERNALLLSGLEAAISKLSQRAEQYMPYILNCTDEDYKNFDKWYKMHR